MKATNQGSAPKPPKAKKWVLPAGNITSKKDRLEQNYEAYYRMYQSTLQPLWETEWERLNDGKASKIGCRNAFLRQQFASIPDPALKKKIIDGRMYISQLKALSEDKTVKTPDCSPEEAQRRKRALHVQRYVSNLINVQILY